MQILMQTLMQTKGDLVNLETWLLVDFMIFLCCQDRQYPCVDFAPAVHEP